MFFKKNGIKIVLIFFIVAALLAGLSFNNHTTQPADTLFMIQSPNIPDELNFAGERVPIEYFDVRESLDRELIVNNYFYSNSIWVIKKANRYFPIIEPILKKNNIPDDFKYLPVIETSLQNSISPKEAVGFWQILESTAKEYGLEINNEVDERYNLYKSTEAACKYFIESYDKYKNWTLVAASYNVGRSGIDRQIEKQGEKDYYNLYLNHETARYIFRVLAVKLIMSDPAEYGFDIQKEDLYPSIPTYSVKVDTPVSSLINFAKEYDINYKILKYFNPWLRDQSLTNKENKTYYIEIPKKNCRYYDTLMARENH